MPRWKITVEYDGGAFCGWQRQENAPSVQQSIEEAITSFCGEETRLHVAGRTDTGVHALAQVAHFDIQKQTDADTVQGALNHYLREKPVSILKVEAVGEDFHARFSALRRSYMFRVISRRAPLALDAGRAVYVPRVLILAPMQAAAALLIGQHDFSTFRAADCQSNSPIKTMDVARVEQQGEEFRFYFTARSFLYHQVRNMVGTLIYVGTGQWSVDDFRAAFEAKDRKRGGPKAPPQGLYFIGVDYE